MIITVFNPVQTEYCMVTPDESEYVELWSTCTRGGKRVSPPLKVMTCTTTSAPLPIDFPPYANPVSGFCSLRSSPSWCCFITVYCGTYRTLQKTKTKIMFWLWFVLFLIYVVATYHSLIKSVSPIKPCRPQYLNCYRPVISAGDFLDLELWLYQPKNDANETTQQFFKWSPVKSCQFNFTIPNSGSLPMDLTGNKSCEVPIPDFARQRYSKNGLAKPLQARFLFRREDGKVVSTVFFHLTRIVEHQSGGRFWSSTGSSSETSASRSLLEEPLSSNDKTSKTSTGPEWVPYLKVRSRVSSNFDFSSMTRMIC